MSSCSELYSFFFITLKPVLSFSGANAGPEAKSPWILGQRRESSRSTRVS